MKDSHFSQAPIAISERATSSSLFDRIASRVCIALALVAFLGASIGLCAGFLALPDPSTFLLKNTTELARRTQLAASLGAGALASLVVSTFVLLWGRSRIVDAFCRMADLCSPLGLAGLIAILFSSRAWAQNPLTFLVFLAITALVAEQLFARSFAAIPDYLKDGLAELRTLTTLRRYGPALTVIFGAVFYAGYLFYGARLNHQRFGTGGLDLGIYVNWCFNALHGHPLRSSVLFGPDGGSFLAHHAVFAIALWLPFYAIHPGADVLLFYQAIAVGLAAFPLYLFASTQLPRWSAAAIAWAYLLYVPVLGSNLYDFRELTVALPWHFLLYWLIAINRVRWAAIVAAILLAHHEDLAISATILGLFLLLSEARPRFGAWLAAFSASWFLLTKFIIMPDDAPSSFAGSYEDLLPTGAHGSAAIIQTLAANPSYFVSTLLKEDKLVYFLHLFAPLAFLPTRRPVIMLLAAPAFFGTLMTTSPQSTTSLALQYTALWIPPLLAAAVLSLKSIGQNSGSARRRASLFALVLAVIAHSSAFGAILQRDTPVGGFSRVQFAQTVEEKRNYAELLKLIALIPRNASVAASENEVPQIAARSNAYTLRDTHGDAEYLLIRRGGIYGEAVLRDACSRNEYGLLAAFDSALFLFKKGHRSAKTQHAWHELGLHNKSKPHGH